MKSTKGTHTPQVGVMFANSARGAEPAHALELATAAEDLGLESLWAVQHVVVPAEPGSEYPYSDSGTVPGGAAVPIPDPLIWLAWVGAATRRIRLATGILVLPQQHPLVVAKQVATLDRLTGGRCILGVGAGWLRKEFDSLGAEFDHRAPRLEEGIEALRRAWAEGPSEMDGTHVRFAAVHMEPRPVAGVPIHIGGHTPAAARRAGRIADGFFPMNIQGDDLRRIVTSTREAAEQAGRDPADVEITAVAPRTPAEAEVQAELGVDRVVFAAPQVPVPEIRDALAARLERATTQSVRF
ncbi:MAG: hypothetical protein JWQ81_288 [Amycolatopsis sp.]|jgi:probable F420-dependent oxidoreductase|uniref:LLM class F420-dependent oxidoreductase n=1 Tax=Amycolatopsis sp. TaxID=37632 RepID=UPI00263049B4|nr:LLM class F420-dependent oxidoreductase [Amycolatopsis sp.]MCU1679549.1 hypothetical protein [Amycolatopsis sp.]